MAGLASWAGIGCVCNPNNDQLIAQTAEPVADWNWLAHYLQIELDLEQVLTSFPDDPPMRSAVSACRGLRLLRQDPWECLASFILSSTKQIVQIQQIIALLCERFGEPLAVPARLPAGALFPLPNDWPLRQKVNCAIAKWDFARLICSPARAPSPRENWIWRACIRCR